MTAEITLTEYEGDMERVFVLSQQHQQKRNYDMTDLTYPKVNQLSTMTTEQLTT